MKLVETIKRKSIDMVSSINLQVVLAWLSMIAAILAGSAIGSKLNLLFVLYL